MSRNGSGTYSLPAGNPVTSGTAISSSTHNSTMSDIASALTASIANDGQTVPVADLPMGAYKHTNIANATARNNYAAAGQVQDSSLTWAGTAGGTGDVITLTLTPAITAYAAGQSFTYKSGASANTTTMTVNVNGVGAKAIQKNGSALAAGDHPANSWFRIAYDGAAFQLEQIFQPSAFMLTVLDDADAATARATLGAFPLTGTTTNDNASAGNVGEEKRSDIPAGSAVSLVANTTKTVTSISLMAGDWDVTGMVNFTTGATTNITGLFGASSLTNNAVDAYQFSHRCAGFVPGAVDMGYPIPPRRVSIASATTVYLVATAGFTVSTAAAWGFISARRRR